MAVKKKGLGKGLDSLIPDNSEVITNYCCPDYKNMITVSTATKPEGTYIAPCNGLMIFDIVLWSGTGYITVNGIDITRRALGGSYMTDYSYSLPVNKNDVIKFLSNYTDGGYTSHTVKFAPMKGAN